MSSLEVDGVVTGGDHVQLGEFDFEVVHTPGHAPGHISLYDGERGVMFTGDVVGAVVAWYSPSSGGVCGYLESLEKIHSRRPGILLPSHGKYIRDVDASLEEVRSKILGREKRILEALTDGPRSIRELNDMMFPNELIRPYPGIQITESHIIKLEEEGSMTRFESAGIPYVSTSNG